MRSLSSTLSQANISSIQSVIVSFSDASATRPINKSVIVNASPYI